MSIQFKQSLILGVCLMSSSWSFAAVKEYQLVIDESPVMEIFALASAGI